MIRNMFRFVFLSVALAVATPSRAADAATASPPAPASSKFKDPEDGHFDVSASLDSAGGFLPIFVPITEPAVGYGAVLGAVFMYGNKAEKSDHFVRPNIAAVGWLKTENGTEGWFGAHLGTWRDDHLRTLVALTDVDVNLQFFGLGGDRVEGAGLGYSIKARGGVAGGSYRVGDSQVWMGMRFLSVRTTVGLDPPLQELPGVPAADYNLRLGAVTPSITFDRRDNFFTPTSGWYVDLSVPVYRQSLGSDRDFETLNLTALYYRPLGRALYLGVRASGKDSTDDTPFFLRPFVALRGVQALRYQGERVGEIEAEIRWQLYPRFSVLGFAGAGSAHSSSATDRVESVTAGGAGFRYLIARRYGLHLGLDVAGSPDDRAIYVVFGNAWLRP
jgi:hypothetical protein